MQNLAAESRLAIGRRLGHLSDGESLGLGSEAARAALLEECLRVLDYRGGALSPRLADWAVDQAAEVLSASPSP